MDTDVTPSQARQVIERQNDQNAITARLVTMVNASGVEVHVAEPEVAAYEQAGFVVKADHPDVNPSGTYTAACDPKYVEQSTREREENEISKAKALALSAIADRMASELLASK